MDKAPESTHKKYYPTDPSYVCPKCGGDEWYISSDLNP